MNKYEIKDQTIIVKLCGGRECLLNLSEFWILEKFKLYTCKGHVKAERHIDTEYGAVKQTVYLHRLVCGLTNKNGTLVDHENRNGHDNRRENLRFATTKQNSTNKSFQKSSAIPFKGVSRRKNHKTKPFGAFFKHGKSNNLGYFKTPEEAAVVYDINALIHHEDFAYLNFPEKINNYRKIIIDNNLDKKEVLVKYSLGYAKRRVGSIQVEYLPSLQL